MNNLRDDFRYSLRALMARPMLVAIAVLTLALGIGANTAIFSVMHGLLLRPLPYPADDRLVEVHNTYPNMGLENAGVSIPDYLDRREHAPSLEDSALYTFQSYNLAEPGAAPERFVGIKATPSLFSTLGVRPAIGRAFDDSHAQVGADRVVLLSDELWRNRFNADPGIVGRDVRLNGEDFRVLGVMPAGFDFPGDIALWTPYAFTPDQVSDQARGNEFSSSVGRLRPGATITSLDNEMDVIVQRNLDRLEAAIPGARQFVESSGFTGRAQPFRQFQVGDTRAMVLIVQAAVALVLLIACANVANLMLTRVNARQKELSVRSALGASRRRIARQLLIEVMLLSLVGGALGIALAWLSLDLMPLVGIEPVARDYAFRLDGQVLAFALVVSVLAGVLAALIPIASLLRLNVYSVIKEGGRLSGGGRRAAMSRGALVVSQIALATTLLIGAGLLLKSFQRLQEQDPGFRTGSVMSASISLPAAKYPDADAQRAFIQEAVARLEQLPGVSAAGYTNALPFSGSQWSGSYSIVGREPTPGEANPHSYRRYVDAGFFEAMGIPLLRGRLIEDSDRADSAAVVVVDERLVEKYFPDQDPIGQQIQQLDGNNPATIVGVVASVKHSALDEEVSKETIYWPAAQAPQATGALVVRAQGSPATLAGPMRDAIRAIDPEQAIFDIRTLEDRIAQSMDGDRAPMLLLGFFAVVAMVLSAIGIYGVLAFAVGQRTGELGVRMAIGAPGGRIQRLVLGQGARLTGVGLVLGLVGAFACAQLISAQLFGVRPLDAGVYTGVALFLGAVAMLACWLPARRAAKVNPVIALRHE